MRVALKVAIVESGKTQNEIAARAAMSKDRLSCLVRNRGIPTERERRTLSKVLRRPIAVLFPDEAVPA